METVTAREFAQNLLVTGVFWLCWLTLKEVLFAFNKRLKFRSGLSWFIALTAFFVALKGSGVWDIPGFLTSWDVTKKLVLLPVAVALALTLCFFVKIRVVWMSKGGPALRRGPTIKTIKEWRDMDKQHGGHEGGFRQAYIFEPTERLRLYRAAMQVFIFPLVLGGMLPYFSPAIPVGPCHTVMWISFACLIPLTLAMVFTKAPRPTYEMELQKWDEMRNMIRTSNRAYIAQLAAVPQRLVPTFWEIVEGSVFAVIVTGVFVRSLSVPSSNPFDPSLRGQWFAITTVFWFFLLGIKQLGFDQGLKRWLRGQSFYAQLVDRHSNWVIEPAISTQPFGGAAPAAGQELAGL